MDDTTFKTRTVQEDKEPVHEAAEETTQSIIREEPPYTEYASENGVPYLAEHYQLGENWKVFSQEVNTLDHYIRRKINDGEIANTPKAVKKVIAGMEKLNNLKDEERTVIKLETLSAYINFLNEVDGIRFNWRKYGRT